MDNILDKLEQVIISKKKEEFNPNSYTHTLFKKGINEISKKFGEEAVEVIIASLNKDNKENIKNEIADLLYHLLVLMIANDITLLDVEKILNERFGISGIEEKNNRK